MIKLIKLLLDAKANSEAAYAAFLSASGSAILFGTVGLMLLRYLRHVDDSEANEERRYFEQNKAGVEALLIGGGIVTQADINEHGLLVALKKALDAKK